MKPLLLICLLSASVSAIETAQDQVQSLEDLEANAARAVARSLVPVIAQQDDPQAADLQWILKLPYEVRSRLVNELSTTDEQGRAARALALQLILERDQVANFRARAASGLSANHSRPTRDALVAALQDVDASVRLMACQSLMYCDDHSVARAVLPLLEDRAQDVRYVAARTLGRLDAKDALPALRKLYKRSQPGSSEVTNLAEAFSRLGDEAMALEAIGPLLGSENWNVRHSVHLSLQRVKSKAAVPLLINILDTEMRRELSENRKHGFRLPTRTMRGVCRQLDERTGQTIGVDAKSWIAWWARHSAKYGSPANVAPGGEDFDQLCARYALVIKNGHEPGLPEQFTARFRLTEAKVAARGEPASDWSETVAGVRIRVLAPGSISRKGNVRLNVLVQNVTGKAITMPNFSLPPTIDHERGPKRKYARPSLQYVWSLSPQATVVLSIVIKAPASNQIVHASAGSAVIVGGSIQLPASVAAGRYELVFTFDSTPASDLGDDSIDAASGWQGKLTSPPVVVRLVDEL